MMKISRIAAMTAAVLALTVSTACSSSGGNSAATGSTSSPAGATSQAAGASSQTPSSAPTSSAAAGPSSASSAPSVPAGKQTIAILNLANVPSLNDIVTGLTDELKAEGYDDSKLTIDSQNANGDISVAQTIAAKFVADNPDAIVTVTTPALQAALNATKPSNTVPVLFAAVSDPVSAGAVKSLDGATGTNVAGIYNRNPIPQALDLAKQIVPTIQTIGIIYNAGEDNSVADAKVIKSEADKRGLHVEQATVTSSNDVQAAAQSILGKVDAILLMEDTTVATADAAVFTLARAAKKPVFSYDSQLVNDGAVAGLGPNNKQTGAQLAKLVVQVLQGKKVGEIPLEPTAPAGVVVNTTAAAATGLTIPDDVLKTAQVVKGK